MNFFGTGGEKFSQFLFRIEKGVLDINDPGVNEYFPPEEIRVPFRNMVYIGDSDTDIPCMKLVNSYGGHSIGVYSPETGDKTKVFRMTRDDRIRYYAPADYSEGGEMDTLVKAIIDKTAAYEVLQDKHISDVKETRQAEREAKAQTTVKKAQALEAGFSFNLPNMTQITEEISKAFESMQKLYASNLYRAVFSSLSSDFDAEDEGEEVGEEDVEDHEDKPEAL